MRLRVIGSRSRRLPAARMRAAALPAAALVLALAGCSRPHKPQARPPAEVSVVVVRTSRVALSDDLTGRARASQSSDVRPQVDGIVQARLFQEGSLVKAGQALYQIDPRAYQAALDQAQAQLESAQVSLAASQSKAGRYRTLTDSQAISRQTIDDVANAARMAAAAVHQYQAAVEVARLNLEYTKVAAPITGRISRSSVTAGALVTANQAAALATIQQLDPIYVDIAQSSANLLRLRRSLATGSVLPGSAAVQVTLEDGSVYPQPGHIQFAEATVDENSGTVTLRATIPNPDGVLLPGMFVRVSAAQGVVPDAILVPQQGITRDARGNGTALLVDDHDVVRQRAVVANRAVGDQWLVTDGLHPGDRLIVEGVDNAVVGEKVKPLPATPAP